MSHRFPFGWGGFILRCHYFQPDSGLLVWPVPSQMLNSFLVLRRRRLVFQMWGMRRSGRQAPNSQLPPPPTPPLPSQKRGCCGLLCKAVFGMAVLGSAPAAIRSCYGWRPAL